jgi:hypothetical protein
MHKIIIIGTNPPCPRCKLLTDVITAKLKELDIDAEVKHLAYTDDDARVYAKSLGLETGTASLVAKRLNIEIDITKKRATNFESEYNKECDDYNLSNWSYELDELLRPFELKAKELVILMTPAFAINNELKNQGSVPRLHKLEEWLKELLIISKKVQSFYKNIETIINLERKLIR